jgi:hypothetical protein
MQTIRVTGLDKLLRVLLRGSPLAIDATRRALYEEAQIILGKSLRQVPFEHGTLAGSGMVHDPVVMGKDIMVEISYGGPAMDRSPRNKGEVNVGYARIQHERLDFKHAAGRKANYLKDPVDDAAKTLQAKLVKRVSAIIEGIV